MSPEAEEEPAWQDSGEGLSPREYKLGQRNKGGGHAQWPERTINYFTCVMGAAMQTVQSEVENQAETRLHGAF